MATSRFPIRIDPWWWPLLFLFGWATAGNSYVELTEEALEVRFGWPFRRRFPRGDIEGAATRTWPLWYGIGWRINFRGIIGLIGSYRGVVEIRLRRRVRVWFLFPCRSLAVSLKDPEGFLEALGG